jgi:hypothetical protein
MLGWAEGGWEGAVLSCGVGAEGWTGAAQANVVGRAGVRSL